MVARERKGRVAGRFVPKFNLGTRAARRSGSREDAEQVKYLFGGHRRPLQENVKKKIEEKIFGTK
jgi:hypothetical protein